MTPKELIKEYRVRICDLYKEHYNVDLDPTKIIITSSKPIINLENVYYSDYYIDYLLEPYATVMFAQIEKTILDDLLLGEDRPIYRYKMQGSSGLIQGVSKNINFIQYLKLKQLTNKI